jgi:oligosaccharide amylase
MRDIPVGNGSFLVNFDDKYQIRDVFFPHVGQENHSEGSEWRFGIWADGEFSWVSSESWERDLRYLHETLVTDVRLTNEDLGIEVICNDTVASHMNIFLRRIRVRDLRGAAREVRVFLHQDLRIYENKVGDTAYYDPVTRSLIHYQKHRYFLINTSPHFDSFATGRKEFKGQEGTWRDAEDGNLQGGAVTEGSVDSTVGISMALDPYGESEFFYWIAAGFDHKEVAQLNEHVHERRPQKYMDYTANYWRAWVNKNDADLEPLPAHLADHLRRSLLILHTQIDNDGAILAANDWDVTLRATDHYSYLWTRDGAFVAQALDLAGFAHLTRKFFDFCGRIVHPEGYFLQKYNADGTVASGWHPAWDVGRNTPLAPIQEDETALVLWSLWEHYDRYRDIEFAHRLYKTLVIPCADFMSNFVDPELELPRPSWNLWEDRRGIHTFTCSTVVAGLRAASNFATLFAERERAEEYGEIAERIVTAIRKHLYSSEHGRFLRSLQAIGDGGYEPDATVDASLFGIFYFGCFSPDDEKVMRTMAAVEKKLAVSGGIARFENDGYMRVSDEFTGNAWFIATLWLAEYHIAAAKRIDDLKRAYEILSWVVERSLPSGVLAEQLDPLTNEHISVSPLTWSHSTFVTTALHYREKLRSLSGKGE